MMKKGTLWLLVGYRQRVWFFMRLKNNFFCTKILINTKKNVKKI